MNTTELITRLRERYAEPEAAPKCHICGAEMTVQRMSASRITYGCTGATYDDTGCHYAAGRSIADDHYGQSCVTIVDVSDPDVLALLDELEAKDKLIAELEARAVTVAFKPLPLDELGSARDGKKYSPSFGAGYNCAVIHCDTELRQACANAGIRINGED